MTRTLTGGKILELQVYRNLLAQLPITNPTSEQMAAICPHLTAEEAIEAFATEPGHVACPPLLVNGAFQVISYRGPRTESIKGKIRVYGEMVAVGNSQEQSALLFCASAGRTPDSYNGNSFGDTFDKVPYIDKAVKFAQDNWGSKLVWDTWEKQGILEILIQDLTGDGICNRVTKMELCATLSVDMKVIVSNLERPYSEQIDEAITHLTINPYEINEIRGARTKMPMCCCGNCGGGLCLKYCTGCKAEFLKDSTLFGWRTPLSKKMVEFLRENGHVFKIDPEIARAAELEDLNDYLRNR